MIAYCTPEHRNLSHPERAFVEFLVRTSAPDRLNELEDLSVIARCGCGHCPGVLFGSSPGDQPITQDAYLIADMMTPVTPEGFIGVMLWATDSRISELEFSSFGNIDITELPSVTDLKPFVAA